MNMMVEDIKTKMQKQVEKMRKQAADIRKYRNAIFAIIQRGDSEKLKEVIKKSRNDLGDRDFEEYILPFAYKLKSVWGV